MQFKAQNSCSQCRNTTQLRPKTIQFNKVFSVFQHALAFSVINMISMAHFFSSSCEIRQIRKNSKRISFNSTEFPRPHFCIFLFSVFFFFFFFFVKIFEFNFHSISQLSNVCLMSRFKIYAFSIVMFAE